MRQNLFRAAGLYNEESPARVEALLALKRGAAAVELFWVPGEARLLGIHLPGSKVALFGFWETTDDAALTAELFAAFERWAKRRGCTRVEGPKNFNTFHNYRLRLGDAPWQQFTREPVNPSYYPALLEQAGYTVIQRSVSRLISARIIPRAYTDKQALLAGLKSLPYEFIPLTREVWARRAPEIFALVGDIFGRNPGYQPISVEEFELQYDSVWAASLCPHTSVLLAERGSGRLVALSLCYPNYAPLRLQSPPVFAEHYPLLEHRTMLAKTQGVHPDYRQRGLMNYLGAYGMMQFRDYYDDTIFCLMREGNPSLRFTERGLMNYLGAYG